MKDVVLNPLDKDQRKLLQFGVILIVASFLIGYYFFHNKSNHIKSVHNNSVYLQNLKLQVFDDQYSFKSYPDRILLHYPYLLFVEGNKPLTTIYNLETKTKEKEVKEVLLDYYDGNMIFNKKTTFLNDINLDKYCDSAFYKNEQEILCITRPNADSFNNMLISIPSKSPNLWKSVYQPEKNNILTTVTVINDDLYIGKINFETKQNYLTINENIIPVESNVNLIYQMNGETYFASFRSELNHGSEEYYRIEKNNLIKSNEGKIVFYR